MTAPYLATIVHTPHQTHLAELPVFMQKRIVHIFRINIATDLYLFSSLDIHIHTDRKLFIFTSVAMIAAHLAKIVHTIMPQTHLAELPVFIQQRILHIFRTRPPVICR